MFVCPICHNSNPLYIGYKDGKPYCRRCIRSINVKKVEDTTFYLDKEMHANIKYPLTTTQKEASNSILEYVKKGESVIVNAVCGAGKTELVYASIEYFINNNKKVAFTIPRKDVVIEIYERLKKDYSEVKMALVYGDHHDYLNAQLVVLTTHQLFRYKDYFDLLILDEADAFPYYGDELLGIFLKDSKKGPIIYLSATIKDSYKKECQNIVYVNRRFHNVDLPVPKYVHYFSFNKIKILKKTLLLLPHKQVLIFVPTIEIGKRLAKKTNIPFIYSSFKEKQEYIDKFKKKKIRLLITTSILERGVTFFDVQVIVYEANHFLFDESTLVQIAGRVGRKIKAPTGKVFFLATNISDSMKKCINEIKSKNEKKE